MSQRPPASRPVAHSLPDGQRIPLPTVQLQGEVLNEGDHQQSGCRRKPKDGEGCLKAYPSKPAFGTMASPKPNSASGAILKSHGTIERQKLSIERIAEYLADSVPPQTLYHHHPSATQMTSQTRIKDMKRCLNEFENKMKAHGGFSL
ncbi:hypothetical protein EG329_000456 [Mollisiaceae sp. DMI_Dod_QoI]|nr:hypothetical protein EG329_000456 [Helotiales sp. DMI_Dod_QoI]